MGKIFHTVDMLSDEEKQKILEKIKSKIPVAITSDQKILTINGWKTVEELEQKDWIIRG